MLSFHKLILGNSNFNFASKLSHQLIHSKPPVLKQFSAFAYKDLYTKWSLTYRIRPRGWIIFNNQFIQSFKTNSVHYQYSNSQKSSDGRKSTLYYVIAIGVLATGLSYAAVPLYRIFCQAYSYGGTTQQEDLSNSKVETLRKRDDRTIKIRFNADTAASMQWNFKPQQTEIKLFPGETALAFYSAKNPTSRPVIGISTYNVIPYDAGQYFNKIQCFCFEEQMLNPNEEVSMPVFFYIDPEFADDPKMEFVNEIILSYTFFEVREDLKLPIPGFLKK